jgi:hypothetical protein
MTGYIVQFKNTNEFVNSQGLRVNNIAYAVVFSTEDDAIIVACSQDDDTVVLPHEYTPKDGRVGTYFEYHRNF